MSRPHRMRNSVGPTHGNQKWIYFQANLQYISSGIEDSLPKKDRLCPRSLLYTASENRIDLNMINVLKIMGFSDSDENFSWRYRLKSRDRGRSCRTCLTSFIGPSAYLQHGPVARLDAPGVLPHGSVGVFCLDRDDFIARLARIFLVQCGFLTILPPARRECVFERNSGPCLPTLSWKIHFGSIPLDMM